jgi:hypothetical protein
MLQAAIDFVQTIVLFGLVMYALRLRHENRVLIQSVGVLQHFEFQRMKEKMLTEGLELPDVLK